MNRVARLLAAAAAALALTTAGCSMVPGLGGENGIQACASISGTVQDAAGKLTSALSTAASDPKAASKAVQEFVDSVSSARSKVSNADVGAALDKATEAGKKLVTLLAKADPSSVDSDQVSDLTGQVQAALSDLVKACTKV
jgi:hypothetical protein